MIAALANRCWRRSARRTVAGFAAALARPQLAQDALLARWLRRHAGSAWGRAHGFADRDPAGFRHHHPLTTWEDYAPWIARIAAGEDKVLSADPVRRFLPTSGTSAACKLIPCTAGLQTAFRQGVDAWVGQLFTRRPGLMAGRAYWSLSPPAFPNERHGAIPVGFADDSAYLGRVGAWLARRTFAVDPALGRIAEVDRWRRQTCLQLLACADLTLVSVWSPSFLTLLWDAICADWSVLLDDPWWSGHRTRQRHLRRLAGPLPSQVWPQLGLISCWTHSASAEPARSLVRAFPGIPLQPKGLVATETLVSLPWQEDCDPVLAAGVQVVEFLHADGQVLGPEEVAVGAVCEVVVSNGGGLWRYRLGDLVEVTGRIGGAPTLRFLGRAGGTSDLRGEKLHPVFAEACVRACCLAAGLAPDFLLLAPEMVDAIPAYHLYLGEPPSLEPARRDALAADLDRRLADNPHYAHCRRLGQLGPAQVVGVPAALARQRWLTGRLAAGQRLGDIKPELLSLHGGWRSRLLG